MKTAIMTDSNSGISAQESADLGVFVVPMPVIIDNEVYYEGTTIDRETFYSSLTGGKSVSTSQPSPGDVQELWEQIFRQGYDEIVYIPMSSGLSHSCQTAKGMEKEYPGRVFVVDNHRISVPQRESVIQALELVSQGQSGEQIRRRLEAEAYNASIYIAVDTLEFLKKGGRVTPAGAALGTVLNIKPILSIRGERLDAFAKVRGMKKCREKILAALQEDARKMEEIPTGKLRVMLAGSDLSPEEISQWKTEAQQAFPGMSIYYNDLTFSVGCHVGPGAFGAAVCKW